MTPKAVLAATAVAAVMAFLYIFFGNLAPFLILPMMWLLYVGLSGGGLSATAWLGVIAGLFSIAWAVLPLVNLYLGRPWLDASLSPFLYRGLWALFATYSLGYGWVLTRTRTPRVVSVLLPFLFYVIAEALGVWLVISSVPERDRDYTLGVSLLFMFVFHGFALIAASCVAVCASALWEKVKKRPGPEAK